MAQGEPTGTLHVAWRGTWLEKSLCQKSVHSDPLYRSVGLTGGDAAGRRVRTRECDCARQTGQWAILSDRKLDSHSQRAPVAFHFAWGRLLELSSWFDTG